MPIVAVFNFIRFAISWVTTNATIASVIYASEKVAHEFAPEATDEFMMHIRNLLADWMNSYGEYDFRGDDFRDSVSFAAGMTRQVSRKSGIPLRNLLDRETVKEDLENYALFVIGERSGIHLSSLRDVEVMKQDFLRIAGGVLTEQTGIPFTDLTNPEIIKSDVMSWAQDQVMMQLGDDVHAAVNAEWQNGVTLLQMVKDRTGKEVSPKALLRGVNDAMVQRYMVKIEEKPGTEKKRQRRYQNMMAQRKFRARADPSSHLFDGRQGGKLVYQSKGVKFLWEDDEGQIHDLSQR
jgi:hypothetical protein